MSSSTAGGIKETGKCFCARRSAEESSYTSDGCELMDDLGKVTYFMLGSDLFLDTIAPLGFITYDVLFLVYFAIKPFSPGGNLLRS